MTSRTDRPATPALDAWRKRGRTDLDGLWAAACWELTGLEAHHAGSHDRARSCFDRAEGIVDQDGAALLEVLAVEQRATVRVAAKVRDPFQGIGRSRVML